MFCDESYKLDNSFTYIGIFFQKKKDFKTKLLNYNIIAFSIKGNTALYEFVKYNTFKIYNKAELKKEYYKVAIVMGGYRC